MRMRFLALAMVITVGQACDEVDACRRPQIPESIVMLVIEHPSVKQYFHTESPGRLPVTISDHLLEPSMMLAGFEFPVRIVPDRQLQDFQHLRFIHFRVRRREATAEFEYRSEGMHGEFTFSRMSDGAWRILDSEVGEY